MKWNLEAYIEWKNKRHWYDVRPVLSYNALYNFIIGLRNSGKTYAFKVMCVDNFLKRGKQFIWLRRQVNESEEAIKGFFDAIADNDYLNSEYGEIKYFIKGNELYINDKKAGEVLALAQSQLYKSREFKEVYNIVFDEFISEGTRRAYLPNEADVLNGIVLTIARHKEGVRVFMLGNSVKFNNPYMTYFKIKPFTNGIRHYKKIGVLVQMYLNKYMVIKMMNSKFGALIQGTEYFDFAILNRFKDLDTKFISKKTKNSRYMCSIKYDGLVFSFYIDKEKDLIYTVRNSVEDKNYMYVISEKDHDVDYTLVKNIGRTRLLKVANYYKIGKLRFNDPVIREQVLTTMLLF
jgi:hypothetical protein